MLRNLMVFASFGVFVAACAIQPNADETESVVQPIQNCPSPNAASIDGLRAESFPCTIPRDPDDDPPPPPPVVRPIDSPTGGVMGSRPSTCLFPRKLIVRMHSGKCGQTIGAWSGAPTFTGARKAVKATFCTFTWNGSGARPGVEESTKLLASTLDEREIIPDCGGEQTVTIAPTLHTMLFVRPGTEMPLCTSCSDNAVLRDTTQAYVTLPPFYADKNTKVYVDGALLGTSMGQQAFTLNLASDRVEFQNAVLEVVPFP